MGKRLYVGNLEYGATSADLESWFGEHGGVESAQVVEDKGTGQSKGFGFVEMASEADAQAAIKALDGKVRGSRALRVNEARPREGGR